MHYVVKLIAMELVLKDWPAFISVYCFEHATYIIFKSVDGSFSPGISDCVSRYTPHQKVSKLFTQNFGYSSLALC